MKSLTFCSFHRATCLHAYLLPQPSHLGLMLYSCWTTKADVCVHLGNLKPTLAQLETCLFNNSSMVSM